MQKISDKTRERIKDIKKNVDQSYQYFYDNYKRFNDFTEFVCKTSLSQEDEAVLEEQGKPQTEFNILEAFISRQRGEFAQQHPSLKVRAADGVSDELLTENYIKLLEVLEEHLRAIFFDSADDLLEYDCFSDMLIGGFTAVRLYTEYVNEMSFEQNIKLSRVFDPTLIGFDPLARKSHKGDGNYCWERFPITKDAFIRKYGEDKLEGITFTGADAGEMSWSYKNMDEEIIMICYYYEKKFRKTTICKLTNGHVIEKRHYDKFVEAYRIKHPYLPASQVPTIIENMTRTTEIETIERYELCESCILGHTKTNFSIFPLIFGAGNAVTLKDGNVSYQMTRPYVYHAIGIQKLKNYAGQSLGNELENTIQHRIVAALESVPEEYLSGYQNLQTPQTLFYNHFLDTNDPSVTLPPPQPIARTPIPPEITNTFKMSDEMTQAILGSYDAALGINGNQISGRAIESGQMTSNTAALPYRMGYIKMINRAAEGIVDLVPKYYVTPRSLPVLRPDGSRQMQVINNKKSEDSIFMHYDPKTINVKVTAGVNFAIQKELTLRTIQEWMGSSELFSKFINEKCLSNILDNMDIRGIDDMKLKAKEFEQEIAQQNKQQQAIAQQEMAAKQKMLGMQVAKEEKALQAPSKEQIELMKVQQKQQADEAKAANDAAKVSVEKEKADLDFIQIMSEIREGESKLEVEEARISAENARTAVQAEIEANKHLHNVHMDMVSLSEGGQEVENNQEE